MVFVLLCKFSESLPFTFLSLRHGLLVPPATFLSLPSSPELWHGVSYAPKAEQAACAAFHFEVPPPHIVQLTPPPAVSLLFVTPVHNQVSCQWAQAQHCERVGVDTAKASFLPSRILTMRPSGKENPSRGHYPSGSSRGKDTLVPRSGPGSAVWDRVSDFPLCKGNSAG